MDPLELVRINLFSPMVTAFVLGIVARLIKSDLNLPESLYASLTIYLLLAIGLKGGAGLAQSSFGELVLPLLATLLLGVSIPIWSYVILRRLGKFDIANAAAIAAHYGSVSAVTFTASQTFLNTIGESFEGFMPTLLTVLEVPAIAVALLIAGMQLGSSGSVAQVAHEVLTGKGIVLLVGGMVMGYLAGAEGIQLVAPFFIDPFQGALTLFLLELGIVTAGQLRSIITVGPFLIGFGIVMPVLHGLLGVVLGGLAGLSPGGCTILAVLAASASYIAAPAAVRIALPQANPGYYLTAALGITFPFNLVFGIPLYYNAARWLWGG